MTLKKISYGSMRDVHMYDDAEFLYAVETDGRIKCAAGINVGEVMVVGQVPSGTIDHGTLLGLLDDDHTQYYNASRVASMLAADALTVDYKIFGIHNKFGGVDNYSMFEADGTYVAVGDAVVFDDIYPISISTGTNGANVPAFSAFSGNFKSYEFLGVALVKELQATFQVPHWYLEGGNVVPHIHLYIPDDDTGGVIKFGCELEWSNVDDTGAISSATLYGTITRATNAGISKNIILSFGEVDGTGKEISSIIGCRFFRDPTDAADTFGSSVWLRSTDVHAPKNTLGSRLMTSK